MHQYALLARLHKRFPPQNTHALAHTCSGTVMCSASCVHHATVTHESTIRARAGAYGTHCVHGRGCEIAEAKTQPQLLRAENVTLSVGLLPWILIVTIMWLTSQNIHNWSKLHKITTFQLDRCQLEKERLGRPNLLSCLFNLQLLMMGDSGSMLIVQLNQFQVQRLQ